MDAGMLQAIFFKHPFVEFSNFNIFKKLLDISMSSTYKKLILSYGLEIPCLGHKLAWRQKPKSVFSAFRPREFNSTLGAEVVVAPACVVLVSRAMSMRPARRPPRQLLA